MSNRNRRKRRKSNQVNLDAATPTEVVLAAGATGEGVTVDREKGIIKNVAVLTAGMAFPAQAEAFRIDETMLGQCADGINAAANGIKSRISHPELAGGPMWVGGDSIFHLVGRCRNAQVTGEQVRADMYLGKFADDSPTGKLRSYLIGLAEEDPTACGMSIRFLPADYAVGEDDAPLGRIAAMIAVDFVGTPGGNPSGLLSGGDETQSTKPGRDEGTSGDNVEGDGTVKLSKRQRALLLTVGLAKDATDEQIKTCLAGLSTDQKALFEDLAGEEPKPKPKETPKAKEPPKKEDPSPEGNLAGGDPPPTAEEVLADDGTRRAGIMSLASDDGSNGFTKEVAQQLADEGVSVTDAKHLAKMAGYMNAVAVGNVQGGEDRNLSTIAEGVCDGLLLRAGAPLMTFDEVTGLAERDADGGIVPRKPSERAMELRRMPLPEMGRQYLSALGVQGTQLSGLAREQVIDIASAGGPNFHRRLQQAGGSVELAMSTSDFPFILADAMGKVYLGGYNLAPSTWAMWAQRSTNPDFKDRKFLNLSGTRGLVERPEGGEITFGTLSETREVLALIEYADGLKFTRRMQINDDLGVFRDGGVSRLGARAKYKEDDVVYAVLTANAAMADGTALFDALHSNLSSGSDPAVYFAAAAGVSPTITCMFLESEQSPVLKQEVDWSTDDLKVAVRHTVAAKALDWRALYKDVTGLVTVQSLGAVMEAMTRQTEPSGAFMNIHPVFVLVPSGLMATNWAQLIGSSVDPSKANATPNPFLNKMTVVPEPRLPSS